LCDGFFFDAPERCLRVGDSRDESRLGKEVGSGLVGVNMLFASLACLLCCLSLAPEGVKVGRRGVSGVESFKCALDLGELMNKYA